ncbi:MAG: TIGR04255 family protein [Candidatus Zixiibacteriota bacterium]
MSEKDLKNKPLVEAIYELRWKLDEVQKGVFLDPHYQLSIGQLYNSLKNEYQHHQLLPNAHMPLELAGHVVQHQFRVSENNWPLIQFGPGIITVNDTESYLWEDFYGRIKRAVEALYNAYASSQYGLKPFSILLRYIDAIEFDFEKENAFDFLKDYLKTTIKFDEDLFECTKVRNFPLFFDLRFAFESTLPEGLIQLRFARGKKNETNALIMETNVQYINEHELTREVIEKWTNEAHNLTHKWFFKMIEGELRKRFE